MSRKEEFIPAGRAELVELCLREGKLTGADAADFSRFASALAAYYHYDFHRKLEGLKRDYRPFNPDRDGSGDEKDSTRLFQAVEEILERANYEPISAGELRTALREESLVDLRTSVEFDDFERVLFYHRGEGETELEERRFFFWKRRRKFGMLRRVVLLILFKNENYFRDQGRDPDDLNFLPGRINAYLYKNVPRFDLELLFPNLKIGMNRKDLFLFVAPALAAIGSVVYKILPQLSIVTAAVLQYFLGAEAVRNMDVSQEQIRDVMPVFLALLSASVALGGVAVRQYNSYRRKRLNFQKKISDTLFFRNLSTNAGVFHELIDAAEEEECKELILVYYLLLTKGGAVKTEELNRMAEDWTETTFGERIDFDSTVPLSRLKTIGEAGGHSLLSRDENGEVTVHSLTEALDTLSIVWDNLKPSREDKINA